jgi:hypothetical protein
MIRLLIGMSSVCLAIVPAIAQTGINKVDFKNFTYEAHCASESTQTITVKNGQFAEEKQQDGYVDRFYFNVMDVSYGDLNADGRDEAIVLTVCNTGGTGNFSEGFVFETKNGKPVLAARVPGGDRAYGGLRSAAVKNGLLVVESNDPGTDGASCCPQLIVTASYKVNGGRLVRSGKEVRREIYPKERVVFAKGSSGKTFQLTIPAQEGKRLVLGARAGQTLSVSVDSDKASLRLLEDADVKHGVNEFLAKLPSNGDYTIELQNNEAAAVTVTVNVKIQ